MKTCREQFRKKQCSKKIEGSKLLVPILINTRYQISRVPAACLQAQGSLVYHLPVFSVGPLEVPSLLLCLRHCLINVHIWYLGSASDWCPSLSFRGMASSSIWNRYAVLVLSDLLLPLYF